MASKYDEIKLFYLSYGIFQFANSIVQIFVPLYFYNKGFSLFYIIIFFAITQIGRLVLLPVSAWLSSLYGAKRVMSVSLILTIIYYVFLEKIEIVSAVFYLSAFIFGAIQALQSLPFLVHLSKISPQENKGKIFGTLNIYTSIANALGPFLGGFIISYYGFKSVFYVVIALILPSIYLLLLTPEVTKIRKIDFSAVCRSSILSDLVANGAFNFQVFLGNAVWPIFIFVILPEYNTIGFMQTVSISFSLITFHFIGKWTDRSRRKKVLAWGSVSNSLAGFFRIFANSFPSIFLINTVSIFTGAMQAIPWNVKVQEHMDRESRTEYAACFEMGGAFLTLAGLLVFALISEALPFNDVLVYSLAVSSLVGLLVNLIRE